MLASCSCTGRFLLQIVAAAMEASFNGRSISYFGSLGPDADIVEVKTIVEGGSGSSRAAKTKQIDNFQLNLNEVSTEPTESTAPLKRLSCASLELGPCRAGRLTALILCGVVWSVWTLPVHDLSHLSPDLSRVCRTNVPTTCQGYPPPSSHL